MSVDLGALRKFQDTWGPVLDALPAVMDAVAKQADMDRDMAIQQKELDKAKKQVQKAYDEADRRLQVANEDLVKLAERKKEMLAEIAAEKEEAISKSKASIDRANNRLSAIETRIVEAEAKLNSFEADVATKQREAQQAHDELVAAHTAEIKDLEKRKKAAEDALDKLRAKLG